MALEHLEYIAYNYTCRSITNIQCFERETDSLPPPTAWLLAVIFEHALWHQVGILYCGAKCDLVKES